MWSPLVADVRYAVRLGLRRKLLSSAILVSVALGIAATGAIFAVVDQVLLQEIPVVDPDRVVWMQTQDVATNAPRQGAHPGDVFDWRERARTFEAIGWYNAAETTVRVGESEPIRTGMALVSPDFAHALGTRPILGRMFPSEAFQNPAAYDGVVISHRFWRTHLHADTSAIGQTIFLNNVARRVVAVLPRIADDLPRAEFDVWRPLGDNPQQRMQPRTASFMVAIGRVAKTSSIAAAQADIDRIARQLALEHPQTNATRKVILVPLHEGMTGTFGPMLLLLGGTVLTLLLVACGNIGNLLLAQSSNRSRELGIRMAIGGSRARLARQLATETALPCVIGGIAGVLLAPALVRLFVRLYPGVFPRAAEISVDWRVLLISFAAIVTASALAALPLVRQLLRAELGPELGSSSRSTLTRKQRRLAASLVVAQLAASMSLLVGGWLMMQTYVSIAQTETGIDTDRLLAFNVAPSRARYPGPAEVSTFYARLREQLQATPGVQAVGFSNLVPFNSQNLSEYFQREGSNDVLPNMPLALLQMANHELIDALGLTLEQGRAISRDDREGSTPVVVVNSTLAKTYYAGQNVIGKRVTIRGTSWEIVGVVSDKRHHALSRDPVPEMFVPAWQLPAQLSSWVIVRTTVDPASIIKDVRRSVHSIDPTIAVAHLAPVSSMRAATIAAERFRAIMLAGFAAIAAILATIGLFAIVSDGVSRRTREIGLRMALGQTQASVSRGVLREAVQLSLLGVVIGGGLAVAMSRLLLQFVGKDVTSSAVVLSCVGIAMIVVMLVAAALPARRASRIQPMEALRVD